MSVQPLCRVVCAISSLCWSGLLHAATPPQLIVASRIHTLDPERPTVQALLVDHTGRVLDTGSVDALHAQAPDARRVDLGDAVLVPGLIDAHGHVLGLGLSLSRADLVDTRSVAEVIERLQTAAQDLPADAWLLGRGWDQNDWTPAAFPTAADLDAAFPDRPVLLERVDGHAMWANSAALRRAPQALDGDWQPAGGEIQRDDDGQPTGILIDTAAALLESQVPPLTDAMRHAAYARAFAHLLAEGVTGVHDAGVSQADLTVLKALADAGELPVRITAMADGDAAALEDLCRSGVLKHASGRLQMRTVKLYADGAVGSRGAALLADYADAPGKRGLQVTSTQALRSAMRKALRCGVQVATHAIGDRANREVLDLYTELLQDRRDHRWRIEHAQVLAGADLGRLAELGVIASMQPTHATSDMPWAESRVGPLRIVGAYAWRALRDVGTPLALGSDFPVEAAAPRLGLYAAVTRQDLGGRPAGGWYPQQRLSVYEALRGFTTDAAYAGFAEAQVGMLRAGMRADFSVLDADPYTVPADQLHQLKVRATWVDGVQQWPLD